MAKVPSYPVILVAVAVLCAGAGVLVGVLRSNSAPTLPVANNGGTPDADAAQNENPYARFSVVDFELTDQNGAPVSQAVFDGQVTVLTFFFTSCPDPCPAIQRVMTDVQGRTAGSDVRLVSISVDGEHDTPERIRLYGTGYDADFERWTFMTGEPTVVGAMVRDSISFTLRGREDQIFARSDGTEMAQILHPTRLILVGPDRHVIGLYAYNDADAVDRLVADALAATGG
ncbi:MAG: hypothetical protein DHS20C14_15220 [Phycisphaeraceae bacterium]|nr:MAG: hypothetical protein DHS20C14_15220 [Phycisphaeraceae bacterium]